jgi:hypothetical protein
VIAIAALAALREARTRMEHFKMVPCAFGGAMVDASPASQKLLPQIGRPFSWIAMEIYAGIASGPIFLDTGSTNFSAPKGRKPRLRKHPIFIHI